MASPTVFRAPAPAVTACDRVRRELALREALAPPEMLVVVVAREERSGGNGSAGQGRQGVCFDGL